jgi:hypothetical protein
MKKIIGQAYQSHPIGPLRVERMQIKTWIGYSPRSDRRLFEEALLSYIVSGDSAHSVCQ